MAAAEREDPLSEILRVEKALLDMGIPGVGDPLVPQLMSFIDIEATKQHHPEETIVFTEGDRKGYLQCKYVPNGAFIFSGGKRPRALAALNITHVAIQKEGTERNIMDRVCKEVLENPNIVCVRIESILSDKWAGTLENGWEIHNENSKVLFKAVGGRSRRKSKRRKSRKRK
jgi:hypothetical protein